MIQAIEAGVCVLAVLGDIQSELLFLRSYAKRSEETDNTCADQRADNSDYDGNCNSFQLCYKQAVVSEYQAIPLSSAVDGTLSEKSGGDAAPDTADAVASESVESVVNFQLLLDQLHAEVADGADQSADDEGKPRSERSPRPG